MASHRGRDRSLLVGLLAPALIPSIVFLASGLAAGMSAGGALEALVAQLGQRRQNPLVVGLLGYVPIVLLQIALVVVRRASGGRVDGPRARWAGLAPILVVLVWVNFLFWPKFLPARVYPGFPHGLEFVIGPIFFAPVAMLLGLAGAWIHLGDG